MPESRVKLLLIETRPYSAMLDACAAITALMERPENSFQLTLSRWKFNLYVSCQIKSLLFITLSLQSGVLLPSEL